MCRNCVEIPSDTHSTIQCPPCFVKIDDAKPYVRQNNYVICSIILMCFLLWNSLCCLRYFDSLFYWREPPQLDNFGPELTQIHWRSFHFILMACKTPQAISCFIICSLGCKEIWFMLISSWISVMVKKSLNRSLAQYWISLKTVLFMSTYYLNLRHIGVFSKPSTAGIVFLCSSQRIRIRARDFCMLNRIIDDQYRSQRCNI